MKMKGAVLALTLCGVLGASGAIKPILYMHGILAGYDEADTLLGWIKQVRPLLDCEIISFL